MAKTKNQFTGVRTYVLERELERRDSMQAQARSSRIMRSASASI